MTPFTGGISLFLELDIKENRVTISDYSLVAGIGFISPRCSAMGQRGKQPKEK